MTRWALIFVAVLVAGLAAEAVAQPQRTSIVTSKHNLSAAGPGSVRASAEQEICIFCHTPHNSSPIQPVWNRNVPVSAYIVYSSNSLNASPGQPTGSSKLCLSCHDGTIAVGNVLSRDQPIAMAGGTTMLPPGSSNLGTDLSDDHPVSFRYDSNLALRNSNLKDPQRLPPAVRLDARGEMQCTSCHNPHNDAYGKFLVVDNSDSQLCGSCHSQGNTNVEGHAQCASCHQPHTAPSGPYLLKGETVRFACVSCHSGAPGANQGPSIQSELVKIQMHDTNTPVNLPNAGTAEVTCNDCHEPHTMLKGSLPGAPLISPKLGEVSGVNAAGGTVTQARFQYEVCFKCHANSATVEPIVSRQVAQNNTRLEFAPSAVSFHPVELAGKNPFVPSLRPGLTTSSLIYCTDCHNSDTSKAAGGAGANGPHGSNNPPLLVATYDTTDGSTESAQAYALCYRCHERNSILSNASFSSHSKHIVDERTPCSVCHDAHGIPSAQGNMINNSRLMNFDVGVVSPDPVTGRLEYRTLGPGAGECYLSCHGVAHSPLAYPNGGGAAGGAGGMVLPQRQPIAPARAPPSRRR
jgi:predicted CXXCH cytochrome family protein